MKTRMLLMVALVGVVLFTDGCKVGPDYQKPKTASPSGWSEPLESGLTNFTPVAAWWGVFHDDTLDSLIARAVKSNPNLLQAEARVRQSRANLGYVEADLWPTVDANGAYSYNQSSRNGVGGSSGNSPPYNLYQAGFDAAWELDIFGGTRRSVESARAGAQAAEFSRNDVLVSLLAEVAVNYVQVRENQRRIVIARDNIRSEQDSLDLTRTRFQAGLASDLDVSQAIALKAATEAVAPVFETARQTAIHHLGVLLGQFPGALADELSPTAPIPTPPLEIPVGLPSDLLLRRPDICAAERQLAAATAQIGVATADLFPKFSLIGSAGLESVSASDFFNSGSQTWSLGPTVQWRIFDAGHIRANIHVQNALQEQALQTYEATVLTAFEETENALVAYAKERTRFVTLGEAVRANQRSLVVATELYSQGLNDFLAVVVIQTTLNSAEDQLVQSQAALATDVIALYKAIGGGWDETPQK